MSLENQQLDHEMAEGVKVLVTEVQQLEFHPETHVKMEGETQLYSLVIWSAYHTVAHVLMCM